MHVKYMLKRAERFGGKTPDIYIMNNQQGMNRGRRDEEKQRFERFFKKKEKVHYTNLSFEKFAERGV